MSRKGIPMSVEDILRDESLSQPRFVEQVTYEETLDSSGRDAVYIWLILPDKTRITPPQFENLVGYSRRIVEAFNKSGLDIAPYIRYARRSEFKNKDVIA